MASCRILSLDGGGVYGAHTAALLRRLLKNHPSLINDATIIAGTSIGGIIALGLASGHSSDRMLEMFERQSEQIFKPSIARRFLRSCGLRARNSNTGLQSVLTGLYNDTKLCDLRKKVVIPTFALSGYYGFGLRVFHNLVPHQAVLRQTDSSRNFDPYSTLGCGPYDQLIDIAMATSAAPLFFPTYKGYADGGLVANNPAMVAVTMALDAGITTLDEIKVLSIGTHSTIDQIDDGGDWGYWHWFKILSKLIFNTDTLSTDFQCRQLLRHSYYRLYSVMPAHLRKPMDDYRSVPDIIEHAITCDIYSVDDWLEKNWCQH